MKDSLSAFLVLSGGNDHAGIRHRDPDAGHDLGKGIIIDPVVKGIRVNVVRPFYSGHADGMGSYSVYSFQMFCMHQQAGKFIAV